LIECKTMFTGTVNVAAVYPREVLKEALALNACAVVFAHNHPSGVCTPSMADDAITTRLKQVLALVDIRTIDHIIVGGNQSYSYAEHGGM